MASRTANRQNKRRRRRRNVVNSKTVSSLNYGRKSGFISKKGSSTSLMGYGILNWVINHLPFELHLPGGYEFCGPGTKLEQRLAAGQQGINRLDFLCKAHDLAYQQYTDVRNRLEADRVLEQGADTIARDPSTGIGEKIASKLVSGIMHLKQRFGI